MKLGDKVKFFAHYGEIPIYDADKADDDQKSEMDEFGHVRMMRQIKSHEPIDGVVVGMRSITVDRIITDKDAYHDWDDPCRPSTASAGTRKSVVLVAMDMWKKPYMVDENWILRQGGTP